MSRYTNENIEIFINDVLKEELKTLEKYINKYNDEIMEFVQLKNTIQTMRDNLKSEDDGEKAGFKTQVNIGSNIFMEARVDKMDTILVDVGAHCYLELSLEEAVRFADLKIKVLTKECEVLRDESVRKRTEIKLALLVINEREKLVV